MVSFIEIRLLLDRSSVLLPYVSVILSFYCKTGFYMLDGIYMQLK